ncbi:MAG: FkbM family methyltransferase [SAR324 cluster bacterium]|uniref:FkbM family methyltransferase n=1 Tax=SAR324 cluster bacterium TaxID=2024889 RepID=A0A7X9FU42_9DELT|nr:FkbM family methyltransferase [SAR324 cluster bacterium]
MANIISKWSYYGISILSLLFGIKAPFRTIRIFCQKEQREKFKVELWSGLVFFVRSKIDLWILKETCIDKCYEFSRLMPLEVSVIIDIGAAFGDFSVWIAKKFPEAKVYSFEPFPESFALLEQNLKQNSVENVEALPLFASAEKREFCINSVFQGDPGNFSVLALGSIANASTDSAIRVEAISFKDFLRNLPGYCDILKMDCEGAEFEILQSLDSNDLRKIRYIALEYHNGITKYSDFDLRLMLEQAGFEVHLKPNPVHSDIGLLFAGQKDSKTRDS